MVKWHTLTLLATLLVLGIALLVPVHHVAARQASPQSPTYCCASLSIETKFSTVIVGETVTVIGSGFSKQETVYLSFPNAFPPSISSVSADPVGNIKALLIIPIFLEGSHSMAAFGASSHQSAEALFTVRPALRLSPTSGSTGTLVHITITGWRTFANSPDFSLASWTYGPVYSNPAWRIRSDGTFSGSFSINTGPPGGTQPIPPGRYWVIVENYWHDINSPYRAGAWFTVIPSKAQ